MCCLFCVIATKISVNTELWRWFLLIWWHCPGQRRRGSWPRYSTSCRPSSGTWEQTSRRGGSWQSCYRPSETQLGLPLIEVHKQRTFNSNFTPMMVSTELMVEYPKFLSSGLKSVQALRALKWVMSAAMRTAGRTLQRMKIQTMASRVYTRCWRAQYVEGG